MNQTRFIDWYSSITTGVKSMGFLTWPELLARRALPAPNSVRPVWTEGLDIQVGCLPLWLMRRGQGPSLCQQFPGKYPPSRQAPPPRPNLTPPGTLVRDWSLIMGKGGGGYKMGKSRVQNRLRPFPLKTGENFLRPSFYRGKLAPPPSPSVWLKLQAPMLKLHVPQNLLWPPFSMA